MATTGSITTTAIYYAVWCAKYYDRHFIPILKFVSHNKLYELGPINYHFIYDEVEYSELLLLLLLLHTAINDPNKQWLIINFASIISFNPQ